MACYHCSIKVISRSSGRSAVASAAYRSGTRIVNERDGLVHDYTRKRGVDHSEIVLPDRAPARFGDRSELWNEVERAERRSDAQLAREVEVALPIELTRADKIAVAREISAYFAAQGMVADFSVHGVDGANPHAHIMLTMRECDGDGFAARKNRSWNDRANADAWRAKVAEVENRALERAGRADRVDHRSYERRGIDTAPTRHEGPAVRAIEARAVASCRRDGRPYEPVTEVRAGNAEARRETDMMMAEARRLEAEKKEADRAGRTGPAEGERALEVEHRALGERERELEEEHRVLAGRYRLLAEKNRLLGERAGQLESVASSVRELEGAPKARRGEILDRIVARCREVRGAVDRGIERIRGRIAEMRAPSIVAAPRAGARAPSLRDDVRRASEAAAAWNRSQAPRPSIDDLRQSR